MAPEKPRYKKCKMSEKYYIHRSTFHRNRFADRHNYGTKGIENVLVLWIIMNVYFFPPYRVLDD